MEPFDQGAQVGELSPPPTVPAHISAFFSADTTLAVTPEELDAFLESEPLQSTEAVGDYEIRRLLGAGGMGRVYEAVHKPSGRIVALKFLLGHFTSEVHQKRFYREARIAASINHPNTVYVFEATEIAGNPAVAMELVTGGSLKEQIQRFGPMPSKHAVDAILQVIEGLEAAYERGVLHRDVKPGNCMVDAAGNVKVGDFGLSVSLVNKDDTEVTQSGTVLGTPAFASPEQLQGMPLDSRSDQYSVGATLYYLLTCRLPFRGQNLGQLLAAALTSKPTPPHKLEPDVPRGVSAIVMKMLERDPKDRFQSYAEARAALRLYSSHAIESVRKDRGFGAGAIDVGVYAMAAIACLALVGVTIPDSRYEDFIALALFFVTGVLITGGLTATVGGTPGHLAAGLRVIGPDGQRVRARRAFARAAVLWAVYLAPLLLYAVCDISGVLSGRSERVASALTLSSIPLGIALVVSPARMRNGYSAVHDLLAQTRLVPIGFLRDSREPASPTLPGPVPADLHCRVGPFLAPETDPIYPVALGFDEVLKRPVWISRRGGAISTQRKERASRTLPRWLNGSRGDEPSWNAYEYVSGVPFAERCRRPVSWTTMRSWLTTIFEQMLRAPKDRGLPGGLTLANTWITDGDAVMVLDFISGEPENSTERRSASFDEAVRYSRDLIRASVHAESDNEVVPRLAERRWPRSAIAGLTKLIEGDFLSADEVCHWLECATRERQVPKVYYVLAGFPAVVALILAWIVAAGLFEAPGSSSLETRILLAGLVVESFFVGHAYVLMLSLFSLAWLIVNGRPFLVRFFGLDLVDRAGGAPSGARLFFRYVIGWSPLVLVAFGFFLYFMTPPDGLIQGSLILLFQTFCLLAFYANAYLGLRGRETLLERLSGTYIVPE